MYTSMFFTKKQLNSEEFETLSKRIIDLNSRVTQLELSADDLRNKVLRKLQKKEEKRTWFSPINSIRYEKETYN